MKQPKGILGELLFYTAFLSFCIKFTLDYSGLIPVRPEMFNNLLVGISITCSMVKVVFQRYTFSRFLVTMAICAVIGFSSMISINFLFLLSFLLLMGMQDIKLESIVKLALFVKIVSIAVHVFWYIVVFHTNPDVIQFVFRAGVGAPRHFFFMGHANTFMAFLVWSCIDYIYLRYNKLTVLDMAVIWLINIIFYSFAFSNTGIIVMAIVTLLIALDKLGKGFFDKLFTWLAKYLYLLFSIIFSTLVIFYTRLDGQLLVMWHGLDDFLTGRLWLGAHAYDIFGHTILGRPDMPPTVAFWQGRYFNTMTVFDNHYVGNLVSYGIINTVALVIVLVKLCGKMENREKLVIIAFSFFAIMQSDVTNVVICFALLLIGKYLYRSKT